MADDASMDQSTKIRLAILAVLVCAHLALTVFGMHFAPMDEIGGFVD